MLGRPSPCVALAKVDVDVGVGVEDMGARRLILEVKNVLLELSLLHTAAHSR